MRTTPPAPTAPKPCHLCGGTMVVPAFDESGGLQFCVCKNGLEPNIKPTPPAPTDAEVREARETAQDLADDDYESTEYRSAVRTILAELDKAQGETALARSGCMNCESLARAENARLVEENAALKKRVYEGTLYHLDICKIATILGIQYHMTQRVPTFVDTVREWSNHYERALTRAQEAEKQNAAQAEQIRRLRVVADEAEKFRAILGPDKFPYALAEALKEASK